MTSHIELRDQHWPPQIDELQREMERFFDHFHRGKRGRVVFSDQVWAPHVDVYECDGRVYVLAELAGVQQDRIRIEVENDRLSLRGERLPPHCGGERAFYALEVPYGAFERIIKLPFPVDSSRAEATYRDGFLEIVLPRIEPTEPRRVQVRTTTGES